MRPLAVWAAGCRFTLITLLVLVASPALADTDKGGVPDGTELTNGTDPRMPNLILNS